MRYCRACHRCFGDGVEFCLFDQTATREVESLPLIVEGKYRLEQLIAHGGMGSVYRATHMSLERSVAIKILRPEFLSDATARERFNREARAAARLKHPNIVAVYDSGHLPNGSAYLVMELIEGRSLREEMRAHASRLGQMRPERATKILAQVCAGIETAHRLGIIHRDLKPDNVMIETTADGTERVLVLDFGIAKLAVPENGEQTWKGLTDENTIVGTPKYISPEQCTGQPVDARSDVYSLGVLLYEMLTGHAPFTGENTSIVLLKHLQEPPAPLRRFNQIIRPQLEQVVLRALAKQPQQRFPSAAAFAEALLEATSDTKARKPEAVQVESGDDSRTMTSPRPVAGTFRPQPVAIAEQPTAETEAPTLLIERRPRRKLAVSVTVLALAAVSALGYVLYSDSLAEADEASQLLASPSIASSPTPGVQPKQPNKAAIENSSPRTAVPATYVSPDPAAEEKARQELRSVYTEWALAAVKGDWTKHASFYADRVEYFRDGSMPRTKVESRKRSIFGKLDSYWLKFSDSPQIDLKNSDSGQIQKADLVFDRSWTLQRGRKQTSGRAQGLITLRRETKGWRIVSEKQIKK
ncbi:MAG: protein kinase [Acidobacteriota bacterium]|nr:protein kinase [Acidobacteriota bacterium]